MVDDCSVKLGRVARVQSFLRGSDSTVLLSSRERERDTEYNSERSLAYTSSCGLCTLQVFRVCGHYDGPFLFIKHGMFLVLFSV